jgi:hypothetical protein
MNIIPYAWCGHEPKTGAIEGQTFRWCSNSNCKNRGAVYVGEVWVINNNRMNMIKVDLAKISKTTRSSEMI